MVTIDKGDGTLDITSLADRVERCQFKREPEVLPDASEGEQMALADLWRKVENSALESEKRELEETLGEFWEELKRISVE